MVPDLEQHGFGLLEWLYDHCGDGHTIPGIAAYLTDHNLSSENGWILVEYLAGQGLAKDHSTYGGPDASITTAGIVKVQQLRTDRQDPTRRAGTLSSLEMGRSHEGAVHNYNGPVIIGNVSGAAVLAWNNASVTQNQPQAQQITSGYEDLAQAVVAVLEHLPLAGLDEHDRTEAEATAHEVLAEIVHPEPEQKTVRRAVAALKGFLVNLATGMSTGATQGAQEWAQTAISHLNTPFGS